MSEARGFGYDANAPWRTPAQTDQYRWEQMVKHWEAERDILAMLLEKLDQIETKVDQLSDSRRQTRRKVATSAGE